LVANIIAVRMDILDSIAYTLYAFAGGLLWWISRNVERIFPNIQLLKKEEQQ
jgi:hypothetical protein